MWQQSVTVPFSYSSTARGFFFIYYYRLCHFSKGRTTQLRGWGGGGLMKRRTSLTVETSSDDHSFRIVATFAMQVGNYLNGTCKKKTLTKEYRPLLYPPPHPPPIQPTPFLLSRVSWRVSDGVDLRDIMESPPPFSSSVILRKKPTKTRPLFPSASHNSKYYSRWAHYNKKRKRGALINIHRAHFGPALFSF